MTRLRSVTLLTALVALSIITIMGSPGCTGGKTEATSVPTGESPHDAAVLPPPAGSDLESITIPDYSLMTEAGAEQRRAQDAAMRARIDGASLRQRLGVALLQRRDRFRARVRGRPSGRSCRLGARRPGANSARPEG